MLSQQRGYLQPATTITINLPHSHFSSAPAADTAVAGGKCCQNCTAYELQSRHACTDAAERSMAEPTCVCREAAQELLHDTCRDHAIRDSTAKAFNGELPHAQKPREISGSIAKPAHSRRCGCKDGCRHQAAVAKPTRSAPGVASKMVW